MIVRSVEAMYCMKCPVSAASQCVECAECAAVDSRARRTDFSISGLMSPAPAPQGTSHILATTDAYLLSAYFLKLGYYQPAGPLIKEGREEVGAYGSPGGSAGGPPAPPYPPQPYRGPQQPQPQPQPQHQLVHAGYGVGVGVGVGQYFPAELCFGRYYGRPSVYPPPPPQPQPQPPPPQQDPQMLSPYYPPHCYHQSPPHRPLPYIPDAFRGPPGGGGGGPPCPCPMRSCPKNASTGPAVGASGSAAEAAPRAEEAPAAAEPAPQEESPRPPLPSQQPLSPHQPKPQPPSEPPTAVAESPPPPQPTNPHQPVAPAAADATEATEAERKRKRAPSRVTDRLKATTPKRKKQCKAETAAEAEAPSPAAATEAASPASVRSEPAVADVDVDDDAAAEPSKNAILIVPKIEEPPAAMEIDENKNGSYPPNKNEFEAVLLPPPLKPAKKPSKRKSRPPEPEPAAAARKKRLADAGDAKPAKRKSALLLDNWIKKKRVERLMESGGEERPRAPARAGRRAGGGAARAPRAATPPPEDRRAKRGKRGRRSSLKWSNGWRWEGEPYYDKVFITSADSWLERKCFASMCHASGSDRVRRGDAILLRGTSRAQAPYVGRVARLWSDRDGEMMLSLAWYYRPEHTAQGPQPDDAPDEVFASRHCDDNSVATVDEKCYVLTYNEYCRFRKHLRASEQGIKIGRSVVPPGRPLTDAWGVRCPRPLPPLHTSPDRILFCRKIYDHRLKKVIKNPPG